MYYSRKTTDSWSTPTRFQPLKLSLVLRAEWLLAPRSSSKRLKWRITIQWIDVSWEEECKCQEECKCPAGYHTKQQLLKCRWTLCSSSSLHSYLKSSTINNRWCHTEWCRIEDPRQEDKWITTDRDRGHTTRNKRTERIGMCVFVFILFSLKNLIW